MDNFFTTLPLLNKLTDMGMYEVGTIQENRLQGVPLKKKAALQKETRETFDYTSDGNNLLVAWRDNKVVIVANNYLLLNTVLSIKRWSKSIMKIWEVLIYLTSSCHLIMCESGPESGGGLFLLGQ